jgi:phage RecT family recombinase
MADILSLVDLAGSQARYDQYVRSVKNVLPKHQRNESQRYFSMYAQMAHGFLKDPNITDKQSILTCMFNAPKLGLNPDKVFGHVWFIPYKGVLTYQIGYRGMIQMSINSGKVSNVRAGLVYEKEMTQGRWDFFEDEKGQHYIHRPLFSERDRGREICGYSIFEDNNNVPHIHVMDSFHIEDIKKIVSSRLGKGFAYCPWGNPVFEPEMRKKTVIRRHWKTEPMSAEIAEAIESEERNERGEVPSKEEQEKAMDFILENCSPDPSSEEGKKLSAELDAVASGQQGTLPFNK